MTTKEAYKFWYNRSRQGKAAQRRYHATEKCRRTRAAYYQRVLKPRTTRRTIA